MKYRRFTHRECEYFPCHAVRDAAEWTSCLFCWCPLYLLECGGDYTFTEGLKDCSSCVIPHTEEGYDYILGVVDQKIFHRS